MNPIKTIEAHKRKVEELNEDEAIGPVDTYLELFQRVYRDPRLPLNTRLRAARDAKDHEHPKLGVSLNVNMGEDFASRLDAAIARSQGLKLIEGSPNAGSNGAGSSEAKEISAEHQRQPIQPNFRRRV
jgi:hypothetical protein